MTVVENNNQGFSTAGVETPVNINDITKSMIEDSINLFLNNINSYHQFKDYLNIR